MARDLGGLFDRYRRKGDLRALEQVFDRTARDLLGLAHHLVRDQNDAEDLVQATFVTAIDRASSYDRGRDLHPWLCGILARKASNLLRARARRDGSEEGLLQFPGQEPDPTDSAQGVEFDQALAAALARLDAPYREVLQAHLLRGERPEEIARSLDRAPGTVRAQIHRGLERLRRLLPAGVAGGALVLGFARGLPAVRAAVVAHGSKVATATVAHTAGLSAGLTMGGIMLGKKTALAGAAAILASAGIMLSDGIPTAPLHPERAQKVEVHSPAAVLVGDAALAEVSDRQAPEEAASSSARADASAGRIVIRGQLLGLRPGHADGFTFKLVREAESINSYFDRLGALSGDPAAYDIAQPSRIGMEGGASLLLPQAFKLVSTDGGGFTIENPSDVPLANVKPDKVTLHPDGSFELDLTKALGEAQLDAELTFTLRAEHELYFAAEHPVAFGPGDQQRARDGEEVSRAIDLTPEHAAVLRGVARSGRVLAGNIVQLGNSGLASTDVLRESRLAGTLNLVPVIEPVLQDVEPQQFVVLSGLGESIGASISLSFTVYSPIQLALVRPGGSEPLATTMVRGENFEFKVAQDGEFEVVALMGDRPPVTVPVELKLASLTELEDPLELAEGPEITGLVEDYGAFPGGGLQLEARRMTRNGEAKLKWGKRHLGWSGGQVVRTLARTETEGDGTFTFKGLSAGDHLVGMDLHERTLFDEDDVAATRVNSPVPASGLELIAPLSVLEVAAVWPAGVAEEQRVPLKLTIFDQATGKLLGETRLDGDGRADLIALPERTLRLVLKGQGFEFPTLEPSAPKVGGRRRVTMPGTVAEDSDGK